MSKDILKDVLAGAYQTIAARANERDVKQERSMAATVKAFNAMHDTNLTESQGWSFMELLKMKRGFTGKYRLDDPLDQVAYTALRAESYRNETMAQEMAAELSNETEALIRKEQQDEFRP